MSSFDGLQNHYGDTDAPDLDSCPGETGYDLLIYGPDGETQWIMGDNQVDLMEVL